jgi:HEAT repeat protein
LCQNFASLIRAGRGEEMRYPPSPLRRVSANLIRRSGNGPMLVDLILAEMEGKPKDGAIPKDIKPLFENLRQILKPEFVREGLSNMDCLLGAFYDLADDKAIVPRLIPLLRSKCLLVRIYAGMTLGKLRATEAVGPIVEVVKEGYAFPDCTSPVSAKHTSAFVKVDGKRRRQSQTVRWLGYLCNALGHIGNKEARQALERLAADPKSPRDVRYGSVIGLGHIASMESVPVLETVAEKDIIWMIRDIARRTVMDIKIANQTGGKATQNTQTY